MQGVKRTLAVLEAVAGFGRPVGVGELARQLDLPKSTVQRLLWALSEAGWIRSDGEEQTRWSLTSRALIVGQQGSREGALREAALQPMRALRDLTGETVTLQVPGPDFTMVQIERVDSEQAVRTFVALGAKWPLSTTAGGLAYLANMPPAFVDEYLGLPIAALTDRTVTDPDEIRASLRDAEMRGYAINEGQNRPGVCAVGCVVRYRTAEPAAVLGISVPESRFDEARGEQLGEEVQRTARLIESRL